MIRKTITAIQNYFTDRQEPEEIFMPLAKLEKPASLETPELKPCYKNLIIQKRAKYMNPLLRTIMEDMIFWVEIQFKFTPVITETVTLEAEDLMLKRQSKTHQEGRAFDMRSLGWSDEQKNKFMDHFKLKFGHLGALSVRTGKPNFIVHHNVGHGPHFHVQINAAYKVDGLQEALLKMKQEGKV